jgi:hypothetical protein
MRARRVALTLFLFTIGEIEERFAAIFSPKDKAAAHERR